MTLTFFNLATVIFGSIFGLAFGKFLPERMVKLVFQGMSALTLYLGVDMLDKSGSPIILVLSIVIGAILGELINIEDGIAKLGDTLKNKLKSKDSERFNEGLITAFLLYCVGTMAVLGPIEEGLYGDSKLLLTKAMLDGFSSIVLCSRLGIGVVFAVIPMFIFQAILNLSAQSIHNFFEASLLQNMMDEMTAVGGILMILLAFNLLEITKIRVTNIIPGLIVAMVLVYFGVK
jgi:uncharacterized membrane protein YqgA involved in biofilm formation